MHTARSDTMPEPTNTHTDSGEVRTLRGRVTHKTWSMTEESFRAGGSDYFTLELLPQAGSASMGSEEIILRVDALKPPMAAGLNLPLNTPPETIVKHMNNYLSQLADPTAERQGELPRNLVEIEGYDRMESITIPTSELEPHPMGFEDSITTHTFVVSKVRSLATPAINYDPQSLRAAQAAANRPNVVGNDDLKPSLTNLQSVELPVAKPAATAAAAAAPATRTSRTNRLQPQRP